MVAVGLAAYGLSRAWCDRSRSFFMVGLVIIMIVVVISRAGRNGSVRGCGDLCGDRGHSGWSLTMPMITL